ncbi:MAG: PspC domain-containing protein [Acidaminobacteraceae bacterium]
MQKKLYRSSKDSLLAGVCGGIGEYSNIDPTIVRLLTAFLFFGSFGTGLIIYLVAAIIVPRRPEDTNASTNHVYTANEDTFSRPSEDEVEEVRFEDVEVGFEDMKEVNESEVGKPDVKKVNLEK